MNKLVSGYKALIARLRFPKLSLPKLSLPKIQLPVFRFSWPKIQLPRLKLPTINVNIAPLLRLVDVFKKNWVFSLVVLVVVVVVSLSSFAVGEKQLTAESLKFGSERPGEILVTTVDRLNVRPCPGIECEAIGRLSKGYSMEVEGRETNALGEEWCKFNYNGTVAFVKCSYLVEESK